MIDDTSTFQYDVALSFAGEDRAYVGEVAERLRQRGVRVFYDQYEQATLWGKDLYEHLDYVYQRSARYCVLFASADYARKVWTNHERKSAQARALHEKEEYILPVRFDETEIPGIRPTVAYIDARFTTPDELVLLVLQKLDRLLPEPAPITGRIGVPRTPEQQHQLLAQRPPLWEYLLFAGALVQGKAKLEAKWQDYQAGFARPAGPVLDDLQARMFIQHALDEIQAPMRNVERVLDPQVQERAFGPPGKSGDPMQIEYMGQRLIEIYETFLDWAARIRGAVTSENFRRLFDLVALLVDSPINQMRDFIDRSAQEIDRIPELLADPNHKPLTITLELVLTVDGQTKSDADRELRRLRRRGLME